MDRGGVLRAGHTLERSDKLQQAGSAHRSRQQRTKADRTAANSSAIRWVEFAVVCRIYCSVLLGRTCAMQRMPLPHISGSVPENYGRHVWVSTARGACTVFWVIFGYRPSCRCASSTCSRSGLCSTPAPPAMSTHGAHRARASASVQKLTFLSYKLTFLSYTLTFLSSKLTFLSSKLTFLGAGKPPVALVSVRSACERVGVYRAVCT
jgi:hypothetical protein